MAESEAYLVSALESASVEIRGGGDLAAATKSLVEARAIAQT